MSKSFGTVSLVLAVAVLAGSASGSVFVDAEVGTPHWNRVFTQTVPLTWDWNWEEVPANATQVTLRLAGINSSLQQTFQKPDSNYIWTVYSDLSSFKEDTYEATLTFLDAEGEPLKNVTARLDALAGTFTGAAVKTVSTNEPAWKKVRSSVHVPYDCGWSANTLQAETASLTWTCGGVYVSSTNLTVSAVGMYPWVTKGWPKSEYRIDLAFEGSAEPTWSAFVQLMAHGLVIVVR